MPAMSNRAATKCAIRCMFAVPVLLQTNRMKLSLSSVLLMGVILLGSGCSGINASRSFSPLDFLLPGLLHIQNSPQVSPPLQETNGVTMVASIRDSGAAR